MIVRREYRTNVYASYRTWPFRVVLLAGGLVCLVGCGGAPSITMAGAYFPAWLLCAIIAVLVAVVVRALLVVTGLSDHVPCQLAVCSSIGVIVALVVWQLWAVH